MGGVAIADTTSGAVSDPGEDGTRGDPGEGGSCSAAGGGGGHPGSTGIGGAGGQSAIPDGGSGTGGGPLWVGWSSADNPAYTSTAWKFGAGGYNDHNGGRGGGGCGGGGSAKGKGNAHKGGGGGRLVVQATVDQNTIDSGDLIYGEPTSDNQYSTMVILTFEIKPLSSS